MFLVTEDWYFCSHRLPTARTAQTMGMEVLVATKVNNFGELIEQEGFKLIPLGMERKVGSLYQEFLSIHELVKLYLSEKPDIIHHIAIKPIVYGSFAALFVPATAIVNTFAGLGFLFSSKTFARVLRPFVLLALKLLAGRKNCWLVTQNTDDAARLAAWGIAQPEKRQIIRGSGVDIEKFSPTPEPEGVPRVTFVSRMLWDKGVGDVVAAARLLRKRNIKVKFLLVGASDAANPTAVPEAKLIAWDKEGVVDWWGQRDDIEEIWKQSHIAVLPTFYPEGLPKALLEAAASGRPLISTDIGGCRDVVQHGKTGLLVKPHDPEGLADAIESLVLNPQERTRLGKMARLHVETQLSNQVVAEQMADLYYSILQKN